LDKNENGQWEDAIDACLPAFGGWTSINRLLGTGMAMGFKVGIYRKEAGI
jgi:hypothetical protein